MLRYPFNGEPILTNSFRPKTDKNPHLGEDYALANRVAIISVADGIVMGHQSSIEKIAGIKRWVANSPSDPYRKQIGSLMIMRALRTEDYGNYIKINHGSGISTLYAHLDEVLVNVGQNVKEGQLIGYSDSTGNSTGLHLHWEIRKNEVVTDPNKFDYSFKGECGLDLEITDLKDTVTINVPKLYVRSAPGRNYPLVGSKELHDKDKVNVIGFTRGETIEGNNFWYKSIKGNYFWAGGTNKPIPSTVVSESNKMSEQEMFDKQNEFDARKTKLEARKAELEVALSENKVDFEAYEKELAEFQVLVEATKVAKVEEVVTETPVVEEPVAEPVVEPVVEQPVEVANPVVDLDAEAVKIAEQVKTLNIVDKVKSLLGL